MLLLTPKLEHQVDFGAEAVTLEEALKQWISLIFRPNTSLARGKLFIIYNKLFMYMYVIYIVYICIINYLYNNLYIYKQNINKI